MFVWFGCSSAQYVQQSYYIESNKLISVYIDSNFSEEEAKEIEMSMILWNNALNKQMLLFIASKNFIISTHNINEAEENNSFIILKINSVIANDKKDIDSSILAYTNRVGGNIVYIIRDRMAEEDIHYIMLHEFGHLLGATHVKKGLMYKYYSPASYSCIDYDTAKQVANYEKLNINNMKYCK